MDNKLLSVIIPAYNEENNIPITAATIDKILSKEFISYELLFIDDGSKDNTWKSILEVSKNNKQVHGYCFSRNFGKEAAIYAGLSFSKGDCCVVIDCDLQHPPEKIVDMFHLWEDGYEVIEGVKTYRGKESLIHTLAAKCFYSIINKITEINMSGGGGLTLNYLIEEQLKPFWMYMKKILSSVHYLHGLVLKRFK